MLTHTWHCVPQVVRSVRELSLQRMSEKLYGPQMDAQPKRVIGKATLLHPGCLWQAKGDRYMSSSLLIVLGYASEEIIACQHLLSPKSVLRLLELVPSGLGAPRADRQVSHIMPFKQQPGHKHSVQRELLAV